MKRNRFKKGLSLVLAAVLSVGMLCLPVGATEAGDIPCPGCGSQRALHSLLHLHLADALRYNALLVLSIPYIALLLFAEAYRTRFPKFYLRVHKPLYVWSYLAAVILWGVGRNLVAGF